MSAHTPGPWGIVREDDGRFIDIVDVNGDGILSTLRNRNAESAANIHLLAAAPDLLAALKNVLVREVDGMIYLAVDAHPYGFWSVQVPPGMEKIVRLWQQERDSAIAKAEGKQ
jgi:hypothetical protein